MIDLRRFCHYSRRRNPPLAKRRSERMYVCVSLDANRITKRRVKLLIPRTRLVSQNYRRDGGPSNGKPSHGFNMVSLFLGPATYDPGSSLSPRSTKSLSPPRPAALFPDLFLRRGRTRTRTTHKNDPTVLSDRSILYYGTSDSVSRLGRECVFTGPFTGRKTLNI